MAEVVVFGDVEAALIDFLNTELSARGYVAPVTSLVPRTRPSSFVRVFRTGGGHNLDPNIPNEEAQVTVECWAGTHSGSHDLAQITRGLIYSSRGVVNNVQRIEELGGPAYLPDPLSDHPRYTFTLLVTWRGWAEPGS